MNARKRETADIQMEKKKKDEHLKLLTMPLVPFCFIKVIKNKL